MTQIKKPKNETKGKIAAILIRGVIGVKKEIKDTLFMLRLRKKNTCVVLEKDPNNLGMLKKVKDYITYGEIDDKTLKELIKRRGKEDLNKKGRTKPFFALHPPRGGFERKGIKKSFVKKGVLGYRGSKINELIIKML